MKLNKKRKTLFVAVLMFLFLSLLAGCGGKKTKEAGTERPEYIYVPEYFNLGSSDYIGSAINYENEVFYYTEAWDDETGKSRTGISKYNFEKYCLVLNLLLRLVPQAQHHQSLDLSQCMHL